VDVIAEIAVAAWKPIYERCHDVMGDDLFATSFPDWRGRKAGQVRRACAPGSDAIVRVAICDGQIVGFITYYADRETGIGTIGNNAVHPDYQGKGIGPAQYEHVFDHLRALGMRYVKVQTGGDPAHAPARRAYEKVGFEPMLSSVTYYRSL
jgi:GNAT superfamily N-acetyltransferase